MRLFLLIEFKNCKVILGIPQMHRNGDVIHWCVNQYTQLYCCVRLWMKLQFHLPKDAALSLTKYKISLELKILLLTGVLPIYLNDYLILAFESGFVNTI